MAVYVIAEAGINHEGSLELARRLVVAAANAGADAIKFQSFTASGLAHRTLAAEQHDFFSRFELSRDEHLELAALCRAEGIDFLSTPFSKSMASMLEAIGVPAFKIASCDLTNLPLIRHCAGYGKPLYISTGMGTLDEARNARDAALESGAAQVVLLQCTTNYPAAYSDVNLSAIASLKQLGSAGFSDHSIGNYCCFAAVALGAEVIEKHLCLDKQADGPDIACSCDPLELAQLVKGVRAISASLGSGEKQRLASEASVARIARRGLYYAADLPAGHVLQESDMLSLRPEAALSPAELSSLIGRSLSRPVNASAAASLTDLVPMG